MIMFMHLYRVRVDRGRRRELRVKRLQAERRENLPVPEERQNPEKTEPRGRRVKKEHRAKKKEESDLKMGINVRQQLRWGCKTEYGLSTKETYKLSHLLV